MFDLLDPLLHRVFGFHVTRATEDNIKAGGLHVEQVRHWGIWREIHATATT
ncbi:MAG: hypothetical protein WCF36_10230 [Candidatus Nanopelagicales bacterium]